jgi:cytochrome c553
MQLTRRHPLQAALCVLAFAQAGLSHADAQAGALIAKNGAAGVAACMGCHGASGEGQAAAGFPRLAGQNADYLAKQLADFKANLRTNPIMAPIASALSPAQMKDVADYYASLPGWKPSATTAKPNAQWLLGERLAQHGNWDKGMPACFACHGVNGTGIPPHFPSITGQGAAYTASQLKNWQSGARKNDPQGLMKGVTDKLSADDISAVSAYLEHPPKPATGVAP